MEKQEFLEKVEELKITINELIDEKAQKLINSGAVDFESYENDFILPKYFMSAMGYEINFQFKPLSSNDGSEEEIKNIYLNI